jgi:hypothetical protein
MTVIELLRAAAAARDVVTITYGDGPHPRQLGIVLPVAVEGEYLVAIVDPTSNLRRRFRLQSIASAKCTNGESASNDADVRSLDLARALI